MDEKQIQIIIDDEIVDSFYINIDEGIDLLPYCEKNGIYVQEDSILEFEAFVAVFAEWR
jgi:hypothetical protein